MRSIFGRIDTREKHINSALFKQGMDQLSIPPLTEEESYIEKNVGLGQIHFHTEKNILNESFSANYLLISDYNREELIRDLQLSEKEISNDLLILKSFEKWDQECVHHLLGDFAFAIYDKNTQELFCARDHLGVKPFNYYFDKKTFVFSTDITSILEQRDLKLTVNHQQLADTISIIKSEKFRTSYLEIQKLPPAHTLTLKNNHLELKSYWELNPQKTIKKNDVEIIADFKAILTESVRCRINDNQHLGCELSGGLDSSGITAIAAQFAKPKTFSHVMPDHLLGKIYPFKDERDFINLLADYCHITNSNFITSEESLLQALQEHIDNYQNLSQQNFGIFSDQLYQSAQENDVNILLSGFGGDEVVTSKSSGYLNELARNSEWKELKKDLKNQHKKQFNYFKALLKFVVKSKLPGIYRILIMLKFQKPWWHNKYQNLAINADFEKKYQIKKRYVDYYKKLAQDTLQEKNIERITHTHVSQRLEYCSLIARRYGIEYRYPLLDIRLIEYYLSVPIRLKARNGIGRYIIRRAVEGIVPEKIQWRNDKSGATIPTVFMRTMNDKKQIEEVIQRAKKNELIKTYIDVDNYEKWFLKLCERSETQNKFINPGAFYNYLKLILFIETNPSLFT